MYVDQFPIRWYLAALDGDLSLLSDFFIMKNLSMDQTEEGVSLFTKDILYFVILIIPEEFHYHVVIRVTVHRDDSWIQIVITITTVE